MIEVERLAELRHPSVLISSPLPAGAAAQRLRRGLEAAPPEHYALFGEIDFEDSVVLWARPRRGPWPAPWKLRGELVATPAGSELRGAVGPFRRAGHQAIAYGLLALVALGCALGAMVAALADRPADAWGAGLVAVAAVVLAVVLAVKDVLLLRLAQPSIGFLLAWVADTLESGPGAGNRHN
jgi:hypothetical protein